MGFLNWEWWTPDVEERIYDVDRFIGTCKGYIVRLEDDQGWDGVAKNTYPLAEANEKHGFGSGADLPDFGPAYDAYVWETITRSLASVGLVAKKTSYGTSHNRIRFDDFLLGKRESHSKCWGLFGQHREDLLQFWAYNTQHEALRVLNYDFVLFSLGPRRKPEIRKPACR